MEWWFLGVACVLTGAVLLALGPVRARPYGPGAARHMVATGVGGVAVAVGIVLPVATLPSDRFFDVVAWLGFALVLVVVPFTEISRRKLGAVLVRLPRVPAQRWWFRGSGVVPVPADQREAVARVLRQYAPHAEPTTGFGQNSV